MRRTLLYGALFLCAAGRLLGEEGRLKQVLIVVEGSTSLRSYAIADGRQLANLLGHFNTSTHIIGVNDYRRGQIEQNDLTFYIGFHAANIVPRLFLDDLLATKKPVVWLNTGFLEFSRRPEVRKRFGFTVTRFDTTTQYASVKMEGRVLTKGEPNLNIIEVSDRKQVTVIATAVSRTGRREVPYIVSSHNLLYIGDSPFASASEGDRYLLFADMLHDILGESHEERHAALIRIEDINPLDDPRQLRYVAEILSSRGIPFLFGVSPFYVDPGQGIRVSLSDKPDLVDALKYMVQNGGTLVMHGVTHQYKGITGSDYEFWDESRNGPIRDETVEGIKRKLDMGIQEFMRNGLYPLIWETPHYTASLRLYQTVARYFSTAMEQRLAIEDFDYSQFFPYIIHRDLFGQTIYPENLGYIPLYPEIEKSRESVRTLLENAKANLAVRDGFASCFFHAFLDPELLVELVEGVQSLGYTYLDLREQQHWVKLRDRVILSGSQRYTVALEDQYLQETWFERNGDVRRSAISETRLKGSVEKDITLEPGEFYKAEPGEFREREVGFAENLLRDAQGFVRRVVGGEEEWEEARPVVLWNHYALGAAYNDQASFVAALRSISLPVDTIYAGQVLDLQPYNLLIVPYSFVDSLKQEDFDAITRYVEEGGHLITDGKNDLAENFGIRYGNSRLRVNRVRDRLFPDEQIRWRMFELATRFDADGVEQIFCVDEATEAPLVIGKEWGRGRVIYFSTRFDPLSQRGTSYYPYLIEYIRSFFRLGPIIRRDMLEVFFDPGFRRNISTESLIKQWVRQGIRIIHAAGWHQYPKYTYDYERLIRLAHANGILVYAWLEPPQVSQKFWADHPDWREKNFRGEDVRPSWRYPVAMTDQRCLDAMTEEYRLFLERYDWDGVDLAEVYFEAGRGFQDPHLFTPMHPSARKIFRRRYGFDITEIFSPSSPNYWGASPGAAASVVEFRVKELEKVYDQLLAMITAVAQEKEGFDVVVTAMDSYGSPELRERIGVDMTSILTLQKRYNFSLQVEDPEHLWSTDSRRYTEIGRRYAGLLGGKEKLLIDLNILSFRRPEQVTPFPTLIQTGTESFHLVQSAALGAPRLTIYAESSVNPQDMMLLPYALAGEVLYRRTPEGYTIRSPYSVVMKLPPETRDIRLDGKLLSSSRENLYLIPAGEHEVRLGADPSGAFSSHALDTRVLSITGNLLSVNYGMRTIEASYASGSRMLVSINREPTSIHVDGLAYEFAAMKGNDCYSFYLPAGHHRVEIVAGDVFSYGISLTSLWSTTAIALLGSAAVLMLAAMYVGLRIMRRRVAPSAEGVRR